MTDETRVVHTVVKVGGGLLSRAGALDLVVEALTAFSPRRRIVIIPGGGPFAEAVRTMFRRVKIGEDAAHWMAVLGMDQYAHALASRLPGAVLVEQQSEVGAARAAGRLPLLAPSRRPPAAHPRPHSWEITRDSSEPRPAGPLRLPARHANRPASCAAAIHAPTVRVSSRANRPAGLNAVSSSTPAASVSAASATSGSGARLCARAQSAYATSTTRVPSPSLSPAPRRAASARRRACDTVGAARNPTFTNAAPRRAAARARRSISVGGPSSPSAALTGRPAPAAG